MRPPIDAVKETPDRCQLFYIGRRNSSSRLDISRSLFEELCRSFDIFSSIWDFLAPFGFKSRSSDIGQAACKFRQKESIFLPNGGLGSFGGYIDIDLSLQAD